MRSLGILIGFGSFSFRFLSYMLCIEMVSICLFFFCFIKISIFIYFGF